MAIRYEEECDYCGFKAPQSITLYDNGWGDVRRACDDLYRCRERIEDAAIERNQEAAATAAAAAGMTSVYVGG